jgi:beta-xylosidase
MNLNSKNIISLMLLPVVLVSISCTQPMKPLASVEKNSPKATPAQFDNPIIKYDTQDPTRQHGSIIYTADPAALVVDDMVYLYTGHDEQTPSGTDYRMFDYRLWTSRDLINWQNKGAVLRYSDFAWARGSEKTGNAYAGHVTHRKGADGKSKYYFYTTLEGGQNEFGFAIGVAVADKPEGPFVDPRGMPMIVLSDTAAYQKHSWRNIDPAVFIDDDGRAYLYWGNKQLWWVELEDDLVHLKGEAYSTDASGKMLNRSSQNVKINIVDTLPNFEEAPFISKHNGRYYLTYAAGFPESLAYAISDSPRGPWHYKGILMDPLPKTSTIHPALINFKGDAYLFYHDAALPGGGSYRRSTCLKKLHFNVDGTIQKITFDK